MATTTSPDPAEIRNIGIIAHIDAGKTTIIDRLYYATTDSFATLDGLSERRRRITITSAVTGYRWLLDGVDYTVNVIDTPGHAEFTVEVERCLRVIDGAVTVFDGVAGVEAQSETVWRQADRYGVPRICFVNKLDRLGSDFHRCVEMIVDRLGAVPLVVQLPIGAEAGFTGVVDLVRMKAYVWPPEAGLREAYDVVDIPDTHVEAAQEWRGRLLEVVAEHDEEIMRLYADALEPSEEQLHAAIRRVTIASGGSEGVTITPVLCGAAFRNKGIQPLLDAVVRYLPSPLDVEVIESDDGVRRRPSDDEPLAALVFKVVPPAAETEPRAGGLTFVRIYSGRLESGATVLNAVKGRTERIGEIFWMRDERRWNRLESAGAGDIVVIKGLEQTAIGETLCDDRNPVVLERMDFPEPVIEVAVEARSQGGEERLRLAIQRLAEEDPSVTMRTDKETGQIIIRGMGELHLEILVDRMERRFGVEANVHRPQVAYRETIRRSVEKVDYTHKKQTGGRGQLAKVQISIEPIANGYEFVNKVTGGRIPKEFIPSVDAGCQEAMRFGILAGYEMTGVRVTLLDGAFHEQDSSELAFRQAGFHAFKEAAHHASPMLLEPVMAVEITTPHRYTGEVIGDLTTRRGRIQAIDERAGAQVIQGLVPLAEMFGYVTDLRSQTSGRASYSMKYDSYAEVPRDVAEAIIAKA